MSYKFLYQREDLFLYLKINSNYLNNFDFLLFGPESVGLPDKLREQYENLTIPMKNKSRSINLANSVGIVMFESIRQANVK